MKEILQIIETRFGEKLSQVDINPVTSFLRDILLTDKIRSNIKRILEALPQNFNFSTDSTAITLYFEIIIKCGCFSNYLTDILVRNPEYLTWLVTNAKLNQQNDKKHYLAELAHLLNIYRTSEKKINSIIRFKRREMLRIGVKDLLKISSLEDIIKEYSSLTDAIIQAVLELSIQLNLQKYNLPEYKPSYCLLALGKLGGNELNYSSDVDLIFFYDKEKNLKKDLSANEFYTSVLNYFIEFCTKQREAGYLFRIDFRLRPDGKYSPLCRELFSYLIYYETKGQIWERQMLLKARLLCGDEKLYTKFNERIDYFIYPKLLFSSPIDFIKTFRNITSEVKLKENDIKHSKGGIRDIEFSVQALQLLNASSFTSLKTGNTMQALRELLKCKLISNSDFEMLIKA
ncbi:MAG: hypothetical protein N3A61_03755 [Ignavibacteria bacterium]|nr:hypothetical protein [Ignavibacteria bacterium]